MKKSAGKLERPPENNNGTFNRHLKLLTGKLTDLSSRSGENLVLLQGERIVWSSAKEKAAKKPAAKKKGIPVAGLQEKAPLKEKAVKKPAAKKKDPPAASLLEKAEPKKKAAKKPTVRKGPPGVGRPERTGLKTSVDELQQMREAKANRAKALLESKRKPASRKKAKAATAKSTPKDFSVTRQPQVVKKPKRA